MDLPAHTQDNFGLRRCILKTLYDFFREYPFGLVELHIIDETCQSNPAWLNWNMVYLEKCGYVTLDKSMDCPPYISCTASITASGIDIMENPQALENKFPG